MSAVAALVVFALAVRANPPLPVIPSGMFLVSTYGAVADGATDNTHAIQNALNAAKAAGGGTVEVAAAAQAYLCGPITLYSGTNLQVDAGATLEALPFGTYPNSTTSPAHFITVDSGATNVEISGGGTIDGNGSAWWTAYTSKAISSRPRLIQVNHADTVRITGVTLQNSPMFHAAFNATNNVTIDGVTITSPANAPNTDAIDPAGQHYLITHCHLSVGDDDVAVKAGSTFCGDITVSHCTIGTGHGVSIGGQTNAGVDGFTVEDCTFSGTTTGLRLKADATQGGPVQNITYSDLTMTNVQSPFVFYSYYRDVGSPGALSGSSQTTPAKVAAWNATPPDPLASSTIPRWSNITLRNVTATGATGYSILWGLPLANALIAHVTLDNVQVTGLAGLEVYNAYDVKFTGGTTFSVSPGTAPLTTYNALVVTGAPTSATVAPGGSATFSAGAAGASGLNGTAPTYQWFRYDSPVADGTRADGAVAGGAQTVTLSLDQIQTAETGAYTLHATDALDTYNPDVTALIPSNTAVTATSATAQLSFASSGASRLANLSVRSGVGTGAGTLIVGFVVSGDGKPVLVRGVGPTLVNFGLAPTVVCPDPRVALYNAAGVYATNDNWGSAALSPAIVATGDAVSAFRLADNSLDAALLTSLDGGTYSAHVTANGASGVVLAEIYDGAPTADARLINLSARGVAGGGDATLIGGFSITGTGPMQLLVRGIGPTLGMFGVSGTLADPQLTIIRQSDSAELAGNADWGSVSTSPDVAAAVAATGAFPLPDGSKDAALLITLDPGLYSAHVTGPAGATGVAMVEVYQVP